MLRKKITIIFFSIFTLILSVCVLSGATFYPKDKTEQERAVIEFECRGKKYIFTDKLMRAPNHIIIDEIEHRKINSPLSEKLKTVEKALNAGASYRQAFLYCFPLLPKFVEKIINEYKLSPTDSVMTFEPNSKPMFKITKETVGYDINEDRLYQELYYSLYRDSHPKINIIPQIIAPKISALDNIKLTNLRSKFSTDYSLSNENRKHNIRLALSKINGTVLLQGQEFAFNQIVGRRSRSNGFLEANIIMDGEYVKGTGGGVCQASTTVYNAALRADMQITMVNNHSLVSSYVPPSFDAMVNSASSDLRFKNNGTDPVFIRAIGDDTTATVEFYGAQLPYVIGVKSVTISESKLPPDSEIIDVEHKHIPVGATKGERVRVSYGHSGLNSEGYLIYYDYLGREISRKIIRKDSYNSMPGIIAIAP